MRQDELSDLARTVIDANRYMALGTADEAGHPWVSPVWFASEDYRQFLWVSSPEARHSQNLSARPQVAIAVFDSSGTPGTVEAVYMAAGRRSSPATSSSAASSCSIAYPRGTSPAAGD